MINLKFSLLIIILDSNLTSLKNKNFLENEERSVRIYPTAFPFRYDSLEKGVVGGTLIRCELGRWLIAIGFMYYCWQSIHYRVNRADRFVIQEAECKYVAQCLRRKSIVYGSTCSSV